MSTAHAAPGGAYVMGRNMFGPIRELRGGASLAEALRDARRASESDPMALATGWSFICLGAG